MRQCRTARVIVGTAGARGLQHVVQAEPTAQRCNKGSGEHHGTQGDED